MINFSELNLLYYLLCIDLLYRSRYTYLEALEFLNEASGRVSESEVTYRYNRDLGVVEAVVDESDSIANSPRTPGLHPGAIAINDDFERPLLENSQLPDGIKREERFVIDGIAFKTLEEAISYQQIIKLESEASDYLIRQGELFERQLPELLPKYNGMYVFFDGTIVGTRQAILEFSTIIRAIAKGNMTLEEAEEFVDRL